MALGRVPKLDMNSAVIIGTVEHRRKVMLKTIITTILFLKSISAVANQLSCANRERYNTTRRVQRNGKRDASQPSLMQASRFLLHLLSLEKAQDHQLRWSRDVKSYCAQSVALNNSTYPKQRFYGGISSNN